LVSLVMGGPCDDKVKQLQDMLAAAGDKPLFGFKLPTCTADGFFTPQQCVEQKCYCANKNGKILGHFTTVGTNAQLNQNCKCAAKRGNIEAVGGIGLIGLMFRCTENGNYDPMQCAGSNCYCVDSDGVKLPNTDTHVSAIANLKC